TIASTLPVDDEENVVVPPEPKYKGSFFKLRNRKLAAINIQKWKPTDGDNIWERSGLKEGDIMVADDKLRAKNVRNNTKRWPGGVVPYYIDRKVFDAEKRKTIVNSLKAFHNHTCVRFRPYRRNDTDYVYVKGDKPGCWSYVGHQARGQVVNFNDSRCLRHGTIIHEFMHALGFHHQHAARDRDNWVTIMWENIKANHTHNFVINKNDYTDFGVPYDYKSIMHYSAKAFSKNNNKTIVPKDANATIGQRFGLSVRDIRRINLMYNCTEYLNNTKRGKPGSRINGSVILNSHRPNVQTVGKNG
ncbi:hypothetical protein DOY81_015755, partial [Sarcophaga bullata]